MATELKKTVRRKTTIIQDNRSTARKQDNIIVSICPTGRIGFRQNRCRTEYFLPLATVYSLAVKATKLATLKEKKKK